GLAGSGIDEGGRISGFARGEGFEYLRRARTRREQDVARQALQDRKARVELFQQRAGRVLECVVRHRRKAIGVHHVEAAGSLARAPRPARAAGGMAWGQMRRDTKWTDGERLAVPHNGY